MIEREKYLEISKDWQLDLEHQEAIHCSGLEMSYARIDDTYKVLIKGYHKFRRERPELTQREVRDETARLGKQLVDMVLYLKNLNNQQG